jgi:hypothetical protein
MRNGQNILKTEIGDPLEYIGVKMKIPIYQYYIAACRAVVMQRPPRWADIPGLFLGNGSVNAFPLLNRRFLIMQQFYYNNRRVVFPVWSVLRCYKRGTISVDSLVRESVKRGLARRNSHCWSRYQETSSNILRTLNCVL